MREHLRFPDIRSFSKKRAAKATALFRGRAVSQPIGFDPSRLHGFAESFRCQNPGSNVGFRYWPLALAVTGFGSEAVWQLLTGPTHFRSFTRTFSLPESSRLFMQED